MSASQKRLAAVTIVGGAAVLGSYVYGLGTNPDTRGALWGMVPAWLTPFYTANMLLAAIGFLAFTYFLVLRASDDAVRIAGGGRLGTFIGLYVLILIPSSLWMPLTFAMLESPSTLLWWIIRLDLALVGLGSTGVLAALLMLTPQRPRGAYRAAVVGSVPFFIQTAVLDALVWPAYFPMG